MKASLTSRQDAELKIASLMTEPCRLAVMEERAFGNEWLPLGEVSLRPAGVPLAPPKLENVDEAHQPAGLARNGSFEWSLPSVSAVGEALKALLRQPDEGVVRRVLGLMAAIGVRTGLVHPIFDPVAIEAMPFRRPATVVSDTSGLLQGGLDFVVRHLPKARVKVPAIVQMEIRNSSHRFFKIRRDAPADNTKRGARRAATQLMEHLKSQGAERALLRLELHDDVEIERTYLLGDPLRSAFAPDRDESLRDLQLSVALDAYVDRLILEAARHHQAQSEPDHLVLLLTSDQGLARMALAEGARPLYFRAVGGEEVLGQRLTGRPLDPFTGEPRPVSLASLLWELATAFGKARLCSATGAFTISALGEDLPWSPFHSMDDLLWCAIETSEPSAKPAHTPKKAGKPAVEPSGPPSYQRMNVNHLLTLICALDDTQELKGTGVAELLNLSAYSTSHYRRFLALAGYVEVEDGDVWAATDRLRGVSIAARNRDPQALLAGLRHSPSFQAIARRVEDLGNGETLDLADLGQSARTYLVLAEAALLCASVGRDAVYPTLNRPGPIVFAKLALARFRELAGDEAIVSTGLWLEQLILRDGIHPEVARRSLEQVSEAGLLRRSTEGSTTQTRYDDHVIHVLRVEGGRPVVKAIRLYRGDYLIPGKASVSLRLEEPAP